MKLLRVVYDNMGWVFISIMVWYLMIEHAYTVNLEVELHDQYLLLPICLLAFTVAIIGYCLFEWEEFTLLRTIYIGLVSLLGIAYLFGTELFNLGNEQSLDLFSFLILGYIILFHVGTKYFKFLLIVLCLWFGGEIYEGYTQLFYHQGAEERSLAIKGYFDNSGLFAVYLTCTYPLMVYGIFQACRTYLPVRRFMYPAVVGLMLVAGVLIGFTLSRTAIVCFTAVNAVLIGLKFRVKIRYWYFNYKRWVQAAGVSLLILGCALMIILYRLKMRSAEGRLLIWKVSLLNIPKKLLFGYGIGTFPYHYDKWQADYFSSNEASSGELLSAGDSVNAFNEYIQMVCESGIIGLGLFCFTLYCVFRWTQTRKGRGMYFYLKLVVLSILITALSFYSFHATPILLLFVIAITLLSTARKPTPIPVLKAVKRPVLIVVVIITLTAGIRARDNELLIERFDRYSENHNLTVKQLDDIESNIYPVLRTDGKFLSRLGMLLLEYQSNEKAIRFLSESLVYYNGYNTHNSLAECYKESNRLFYAIDQYNYLSYCIPSKFQPLYERFILSKKLGLAELTRTSALRIVSMPIKFNSEEISLIKKEAKEYLVQHPMDIRTNRAIYGN